MSAWEDKTHEALRNAERTRDSARERLLAGMTTKQRSAYLNRHVIPKTDKHQKNWTRYQAALTESRALRARFHFEVIAS